MSRAGPPAVAALLAAIMLLLVLPNPFDAPERAVSTGAEYAPVPGRVEEPTRANFRTLSDPRTPGIGSQGSGVGTGSALPGASLPEFAPRQFSCVGDPPRQTEDPLSPPCVPFWEGESPGATHQGVTDDAITVVFYSDRCCEGPLHRPYRPSDERTCRSSYAWECENMVRTTKALLRHFRHRYQTYGREVRAHAVLSAENIGSSCRGRRADAQNILDAYQPFAVVTMQVGGMDCFLDEIVDAEVVVLGLNESTPASVYERKPSFAYGFMPTQEVQTTWSSSFVCEQLVGGRARYHGDPLEREQRRIIGLVREDSIGAPGDEVSQQADLFEARVGACEGLDLVESVTAGDSSANIISRLRDAGVTTIVCYCYAALSDGSLIQLQRAATSQRYFPEWYVDSVIFVDRPGNLRIAADPLQPTFGTSNMWRMAAWEEQHPYRAYVEQEAQGVPNRFFAFRIYHLFLNLFQGIQAAGPVLTPATMERGMFTFQATDRDDVWVPTGGYGPYGPDARSNYTFIDTAMLWWWDPDGTPPGGRRGEGCVRVVDDGARRYADEWMRGTHEFFRDGDPCTGDPYAMPGDVDPDHWTRGR